MAATVPVIAARALEQFLQELIMKTASITTSLQAKTLTPEHIRQHISSDPRLSFLNELANKMATGPNNAARSLSVSSASPTPSNNRPPFQTQLSIPYQDPVAISSTSTSSNLLHINQEFSRSYPKSYCAKVKSNKRCLEQDEEEDDDDDDDDIDEEDDDDDPNVEDQNRATRNNHHHERLITNQRVT